MATDDDDEEKTAEHRMPRPCERTADVDMLRDHVQQLSMRVTTLQAEIDALKIRIDQLEQETGP